MTWTANITNDSLKVLASQAIDDNVYSYSEMLTLLTTAVSGGITSSEFADLKTIYTNSTTLFASDYVKDITYKVIYGNPANAKWWGGAQKAASVETLGDMSAGMVEAKASHLVDKWFLGLDKPMPVAGGDTATGKAATGVYSYAADTGALFVNGATASDINQGASGDCYLVATLGAIANAKSSYITGNIIDNQNGTYGVKFYLGGKATYVTVNNDIPVTKQNTVAFTSNITHSLSGEKWVSIFEKAYVQLNQQANIKIQSSWVGENSYQAIEGGFAYPIKEITNLDYTYYSSYYSGIPDPYALKEYVSTDATKYKQTIVSAISNGAIGWLGSFGNTTDAGNGLKDFVSGHAFMILGYDSATDKFTIRNPWGGTGAGYNPEFKAAFTDFWNATVKGIVAVSEPTQADPVFTYSIASSAGTSAKAVNEGDAITFTITRSGTASSASSVYVSTQTGTASAGDFKVVDKAQLLNFAAFETSKTVTVATLSDTLQEDTESFTLNLSLPGETTVNASATGFIKDTTVAAYTYTIDSTAGTADTAVAEGSPITFTVKRSGSGTASTVYLTTKNVTTDSTDYQWLDGKALVFAAYETSKTVTIDTIQDEVTESKESFALNLYTSPSDTTAAATANGYLKDQVLPFYNYSITSTAGTPETAVTEGGKVTFTITRSGSGVLSKVYVSLADGSAGSSDYVGFAGKKEITFAANQTSVTLDVETVADWWLEADEYFTLNLYTHQADTTYACYGSAFIKDKPISGYNYTITNNATTQPVLEGSTVTFTITRSAGNTASTIYLSTLAGTATNDDYQSQDKSALTFEAYETTKTVSVKVNTDSLTEGKEYFYLTLFRSQSDSSYSEYSKAEIDDQAVASYTYSIASSADDKNPVSEGGAVTFTITRSSSGSASTVYVSTADNSAEGGTDFKAVAAQEVKFAAYETSKTITVSTFKDDKTESTESFWLKLFTSNADTQTDKYAAYSSGYIKDATVAASYTYTIASDAGFDTPVTEGSPVTFTITRSGSGSASSVFVSTTNNSAEGGSDFLAVEAQEIKFAAYETSKTVTVSTCQDGKTEGAESFWFDLFTNYSDAKIDAYATFASGYIKDAVAADYTYTLTSSNDATTPVTEGSAITFTITRSASGSASTIYVSTKDNSALAGSDYQALNGQEIKFAANETSKTVTVNTYQDSLTEGTESFWLDLFTSYADAQTDNYTTFSSGHIQDGTVASYTYSITSSTASETPVTEGSAITFTITRSASGSASTIYVSTTDNSAEGGSDFQALDAQEIKFAAYETSKTVTVNTYQDSKTEGTESFWLDLFTSYADAQVDNYATFSSGHIKDAPVASYTYTIASSADSETPVTEGSAITFTITRSDSGSASTIYVSTVDSSAAGGSDYQALSGQEIKFAANETSKTVTVNTYQDSKTEGTESFWFDLFTSYADAKVDNYATFSSGHIKDAPVVSYTYTIAGSTDSETPVTEGSAITFTITRSGSGSASTVYVSTTDNSAAGGSDYQALSGKEIKFAANETSKTVTVNTYQDSKTEGTESFWFDLFTSYADAKVDNYATFSSGHIKDAPVVNYTYTITGSTDSTTPVTEGSAITFTITRSASGSASTIYVSTTDSSAEAGKDFQAINAQEIKFADYETSKIVTVNTYQDSLTEGTETFWFDLFTSYADAQVDKYATFSSGHIKDAPVVNYTYTITGSTDSTTPVTEGNAITFTITRSGSGSASTIYVSTTDNSATGGTDFQAVSAQEVNFSANETSKTVTVNTYQDSKTEGTESFWFDLFTSYADAKVDNYATYSSGYIKDAPVVNYTYSIVGSTDSTTPVTEGGAITFTITRSGSGSASTIYVSTMDNSAKGNSDYQAITAQEVKFADTETSKTVTVNTWQDSLTEGTESFWFDLFTTYADAKVDNYATYSSGYLKDGVAASYTYTVTSSADSTTPVTEGNAITFTITRSGSGSASTVYVSTTDSSAVGGSDFQAVTAQEVKFAATETSKTVTVNTWQDTKTEGTESFWFDLFTTYADAQVDKYATFSSGNIKDGPVANYTYTIASSTALGSPVAEGGSVTFTITRSDSGSASTVYVSTTNNSAKGGSDFQALVAQEVKFAATETSKTVTVTTLTDTLTEGTESFWFDLFTNYADAQVDAFATFATGYIKDKVNVTGGADPLSGAAGEMIAGHSASATGTGTVYTFPGHSLGEFGNTSAFYAQNTSGAMVTWGNAKNGGDITAVASKLVGVSKTFSNISAFASLRSDGSVVTWGDANAGGDSSAVAAALDGTIDAVSVSSTATAFAALRTD
ncbi:MAG: hypothetical protein HQL95_01470, partial [Magnetococcales bacterium]|nr:hypothetical protein [Magnetococcales bacterium]